MHWLYTYTEGWISALYLLMRSYQAAHMWQKGGSKQEDILLCAVLLQVRIAFCRGDYALAAYSLKNLREDLERGG